MSGGTVHICGGRCVDCEAALDLANAEINQLRAEVAQLINEKTAVAAGAHLAMVLIKAAQAWREAARDPWTDDTPERIRLTDQALIVAVDAFPVPAPTSPEGGTT